MTEPVQEEAVEPEQGTASAEPTPPEGVDDGEQHTDEQPAEEEDSRLVKARNEAKNLRTRLRDAEGERNSLRSAVTAMQRAETIRLVQGDGLLSDGEDLFRGGVALKDLLGEGGGVDPEKVHEAALRVGKEHPNWTPSRVVPGLAPGSGSHSTATTWQRLLSGRD